MRKKPKKDYTLLIVLTLMTGGLGAAYALVSWVPASSATIPSIPSAAPKALPVASPPSPVFTPSPARCAEEKAGEESPVAVRREEPPIPPSLDEALQKREEQAVEATLVFIYDKVEALAMNQWFMGNKIDEVMLISQAKDLINYEKLVKRMAKTMDTDDLAKSIVSKVLKAQDYKKIRPSRQSW